MSLDGVISIGSSGGADAIQTTADVISAISGSTITPNSVIANTLNTNQVTFTNNQITVTDNLANLTLTNGTTGSFIIDNNITIKQNEISNSTSNADIVLTPNGTGVVRTGNISLKTNTISSTDTNGNLLLSPDGTGKVVIDDDLAIDRNNITNTASSDIYITCTGAGKVRIDSLSLDQAIVKAEVGQLSLQSDNGDVSLGNYIFNSDQVIGASEDNYVMTYDYASNRINLEAPTGSASPWTTTGSDIYRASKVGVGANSSTIDSQLMVKDTGASHCAIQVTGQQSQNVSLKLSRGTGTWSSAGNETVALHLDTNSLFISKLNNVGNNLDGFGGDTMRIDCQNSRVGIASYPYAPSTTLQIGSIGSGRTESVKCSTNAGAGIADRSIEIGVDSTSSFLETNDSANAPIEMQVRQGTNGNVMVVDTDGDVGINTSAPDAKLHITASSGKRQLELEGDPVSQSQVLITGGTYGIAMTMNNSSASNYALSINNNVANILYFQNNGVLGLGTTSPQAKIHINGFGGSTSSVTSGARRYFRSTTGLTSDTGTWAMSQASLYANGDIIGSSWIVSLQSTSFSDRRMKENIVDVDDDQCLQKLRLLKPKQYTYKDTHKRGTAPVWGFIAQEVKETLDYAVSTMEKELPNIYKLASVSNDGKTLTFTENIILQDDEPRLMLKTWEDKEVRAVIVSHTANTITLEEPLEQHDITCDEFANQIFVYGQIVSDFHHLDKNAIFTVAVSALQEIDRQQQVIKTKLLQIEQRLSNAGL